MSRFRKAYVEITNVCNLSCSFCPKTRRAPLFMAPNDFARVARQVKGLTDYIYLHVMGEPLLHPQLHEILKICEILELRATITTNGTLLPAAAPLLLASPSLYKVHISLHSFEANECPMPMDEYVRGAVRFAREAAALGTLAVLRLWNLDSAAQRGQNLLNAEIIALLEHEFSSVFSLENALEQGRTGVKLAPRIYLEQAEKFQWPSLSVPPFSGEMFCYGLRDQFGILCDGTVVPCCLDSEGDVALGNVFDERFTLPQILSGGRAERIFEGFTARRAVEALCRRCGYAQKFARSFAAKP